MPVVPRAQRVVSREALPGVRLTAAETATSQGATLAQQQAAGSEALANFGARVANTGLGLYAAEMEKARDRADSVAILNSERRLSEWENQRLYHPETGALNVRGKDAFTLPETIAAEYEKISGEIEAELGTDRQRAVFARVKTSRGMGIDLNIRRHVSNEMNRYETEELQGAVANFVSAGIANANDPARVFAELKGAVDAITTHSQNLGLGPDAIKQRVTAVTSTMHAGVIDRLLATDQDQRAKAYFQETRGQISGESIAKIERALEEGSLRGEAQRQADAIIDAGGTLTDQRKAAKAINDPKVRDRVLQLVEHEDAVQDRIKREDDERLLDAVFNKVRKAGGSLSSITPSEWEAVGSRQPGVRAYAEQIARGVPVQTDYGTFYSLMRKAADDPQGFSTDNILQYRAKLDDGDFKHLAQLQLSIRNSDRNATEKALETFRTNGQLLDDTLALYKIDPAAKPNTEEGRSIAQLRRLVDLAVEQQHSLTGKKPTNQDVQEHIDRLLIPDVTKKGSWWNILPGGEPFFDQTGKRLIDLTIADVPAPERQAITDALKKRQRTVTDQTIIDLYITGQLRTRK